MNSGEAMGMRIMNNTSAMLALGETNKNQKALDKQLKKVATGQKIIGAGDGASEYAISEKMRVMIRSLNQDEQNVQNGATLLRTAEGGVQQQIELLKEIKAKVIDANNDSNTDADRAIIQKGIDQRYDEINDISVETSYNGKLVLHGNYVKDTVKSWEVLDHPVQVEGSDMALIPDKHATLNGKTGPFDVFSPYKTTAVDIDSLGLKAAGANFSGATASTPASWTIDLSQVGLGGGSVPSALNNRGFTFDSWYSKPYVLTTDTSTNYASSAQKIDISGCTTMTAVASKIASTLSDSWVTVTADGEKLNFKTVGTGSYYKASRYPTGDFTVAGGTTPASTTPAYDETVSVPVYSTIAAVTGTGLIGTSYLSGGGNAAGVVGNPDYHPATTASYTVNLSGAAANTGFTVGGAYYELVSGSGFQYNSSTGIYEIGKNYSGALTGASAVAMTYSGGQLTVTASSAGASGNSISVTDGIPAHQQQTGTTTKTVHHDAVTTPAVTYTAITALGMPAQTDVVNGTDGQRATYTIDLAAYNTADSTTAEAFIKDLTSKSIHLSTGVNYEFVDSESTDIDNQQQVSGSVTISLNSLRTAVAGGTTIAAAFANLMSSYAAKVYDTDRTTVTGLKFTSTLDGITGNSEKISGLQGSLRHYDVDFGTWMNTSAVQSGIAEAGSVADYLDYKGFRVYCATCTDQWFNFEFLNGMDSLQNKPASGVGINDIKSIIIDVSKVTDAASLAKAVYEQGKAGLDKINHNLRIAMADGSSTVTIYDERAQDLEALYGDYYQAPGPKIADGILDNVVRTTRNIDVERLYIHHTDKSSKNIKIDIPKTSMDQIFQFIPSSTSDVLKTQYNVMTKASRESLLGQPPDAGILDQGLEYLTDANTLIGAQITRMDIARANIVTQNENITATESKIRDADMAKEMTGYTKASILSQSAQSMLAIANQNSSGVLKLLQ